MGATGALPVADYTGMNLANPQNLSVTAIKQDNRTPMMERWSLQVQHEMPKSVIVSAGYVGVAGPHLIDRYTSPTRSSILPPERTSIPASAALTWRKRRTNSIYHSL